MKKTFDCVEMKRQIQEKLWIESGESIEGLIKLLNERKSQNKLWQEIGKRKVETEKVN